MNQLIHTHLGAAALGLILLTTAPLQAQIYITETGTFSVKHFGTDGSDIGENPLIAADSGISGPTGIAIDAAGNLYVANYWTNAVGYYDASTGVYDATFITGLNGPYGVAVDALGNVYVADGGNNAIGKYTPGVGYNASFITSFSSPCGIAIDAEGNLYFGSNATNQIGKYDKEGNLDLNFISNPNGAVDMAIHGNTLYTLGNGVIGKFDTSDGSGIVEYIGGLSGAFGLATDLQGNLYVANHTNGTITMYDSNGLNGTTLVSGLSQPYYIAVAVPEPSGVALMAAAFGGVFVLALKNGRLRKSVDSLP